MGKLILASASPRRKELLALTGLPFTIIPGDADETITETDPAEAVKQLSVRKAQAVRAEAQVGDLIIGADTVVVSDGRILGKPENEEMAFSMLQQLSGRAHKVMTGVTVLECREGQDRLYTFSNETTVHVLPMSPEEIRAYIATGEPMDKAGAYGIQGRFAVYVEGIEGDYDNVVGLPVCALYQIIKEYREQIHD